MKLRRQILQTVLLQGGGAASALLAVLVLGMALGPQQQGLFSRVKAEVEFCASLAMLGLPQALFYFVKSSRLDLPVALRWSAVAPMVAIPVVLVYTFATSASAMSSTVLLLTLAGAACSLHGVLRGLTLVDNSTIRFNLVTSLPQVLMLLFALGLAALNATAGDALLAAANAAFYGAAALVSWGVLRRLARSYRRTASPARMGDLLRYGMAAWLTGSLASAAIVIIQRSVEQANGASALGLFAMALALAQIPLTPINYAIPVLFRQWVAEGGGAVPRKPLLLCSGGLLASGLGIGALGIRHPDLWMGQRYEGLAVLLAVLLAAAAAEVIVKVLTVACHSRARLWPPMVSEASRCLLIAALFFVRPWKHPLDAAVAWTGAVWCAALVLQAMRARGSRP